MLHLVAGLDGDGLADGGGGGHERRGGVPVVSGISFGLRVGLGLGLPLAVAGVVRHGHGRGVSHGHGGGGDTGGHNLGSKGLRLRGSSVAFLTAAPCCRDPRWRRCGGSWWRSAGRWW